MRIKLLGGSPLPKKFICDDDDVQQLLAVLRSLDLFYNFSHHAKCSLSQKNTRDNLCSFCLIRSLVVRINEDKGRKALKPVELMAQFSNNCFSSSLVENLVMIFESMAEGNLQLDAMIHLPDLIVELPSTDRENLSQVISDSEAWKSGSKILFVSSPHGIEFDVSQPLKIGNEEWKCKAAIFDDGNAMYSSLTCQKHFLTNSRMDSKMTFIAYEVQQDSPHQSSPNLKYSGKIFIQYLLLYKLFINHILYFRQ